MAKSRTMKLMVVDTRDAERERLVCLLESHKGDEAFEIFSASGVSAAMRTFLTEQPDLILIHLHSSEDDGADLCGQIRASEGKSHTGIIFLSDTQEDIDALSVTCLEMGADDFMREGWKPQELVARIKSVLRLKAMTDELRSANHRLQVLSLTDDLTGLANMRSFNQKYGEIVRQCRDGDLAFGVLMMDIDRFKNVNDSSNHLMGSFVLSEIGYIMRSEGIFGELDTPARYGGDEFVAVCIDDDPATVVAKGERIRELIETYVFVRDTHKKQVTCSIGVAWVDRGFAGPAEDIIKAADLMLYRAKSHGRNQVRAMHLKYPVDLDAIGRSHLVDGKEVDTETYTIFPKAQ